MAVELKVRHELEKLVKGLEDVAQQARKVGDELGKGTDHASEKLKSQTKATENWMNGLQNLGRRVADQLKRDFEAIVSVGALTEGLRLGNNLKKSVTETVVLNNTIRKLGESFGIASSEFTSFQSKMTKGLGAIGLSSDVAARTMDGLIDQPVRGQEAILEYSKAVGQLARATRSSGKEGEIARGISQVIQARGGDPSDIQEMQKVARDLDKVFQATGKGPEDTLKGMESLFKGMSDDFRKTITSDTLVGLVAAEQAGGAGSTEFIKRFMQLGKIGRSPMEAQGVGGLIGPQGLNVDAAKKFRDRAKHEGAGDMRLGLTALQVPPEMQEDAIRLFEALDRVALAQDRVTQASGKYEQAQLTMAEALDANVNQSLKGIKSLTGGVQNFIADTLTETSKSEAGSAAVTVGGGLLAAMLTGGGLRGLGNALMGQGKAAAVGGITGKEVQNVYVVNANEISGGMGGALGTAMSTGPLGKMMGILGKTALVGGALMAGRAVGEMAGEPLADMLVPRGQHGKTEEFSEGGVAPTWIDQVLLKVDSWMNRTDEGRKLNVVVNNKRPDLDVKTELSRGAPP